MFTANTSLIIPTRNRSDKILHLLNQINKNKINFKEIIIVDSSDRHHKTQIKKSIDKKIQLFNTYPSTTHQRNLGLQKANSKSKYILFLDDDLEINSTTFKKMDVGIKKYSQVNDICSFGFNLISGSQKNKIQNFKESKLIEYLGLYSGNPGKVLESGWHTRISDLKKNTYVEWVYSGAVIFKSHRIKNMKFPNLNRGYNYLEDLFFSYELTKKKNRHIIISGARVYNFHFVERNDFSFGLIEIINRHKFVEKYSKRKINFYFTAVVRMLYLIKNIFRFKFLWAFRFLGNCVGLANCLKKDLRKISK